MALDRACRSWRARRVDSIAPRHSPTDHLVDGAVVVFFSMSFLTDINLGLRYVLPILPYVFIAAGKVVPWILGMHGTRKRVMASIAAGSLALTLVATAFDSPALPGLFQLGLGRAGPDAGATDRQQPRLGAGPGWSSEMVEGEHPGRADRPGLLRADQPFDLRDARRAVSTGFCRLRGRERLIPLDPDLVPALVGPAQRLKPGYYAVSVSCSMAFRGGFMTRLRETLLPAWNAFEAGRVQLLQAPTARQDDRAFDQHLSAQRRGRCAIQRIWVARRSRDRIINQDGFRQT